MHIVLTWGWTVPLTKYEEGMWFTHSLRCSFQLDGLGLVLKSSKELTLHILTCREANEPLVLQEQWLDSFPFVKMVKWLFSTECIVLFFSLSALQGELLSPCRCDGSVRCTHQPCLIRWISERGSWSCELCYFKYQVLAISTKNPLQVMKEFIPVGVGLQETS